MKGAIPYYRFQESIAREEARAGYLNSDTAGNAQVLLGNMAHHVNNLLMRIQGYISLMLMDIADGEEGFERLKHVENHIAYGAVLTSQLLACTGRGVYADPVNIPPLLLETADASEESDAGPRMFVVASERGPMPRGRARLSLELTLKIAGIFTRIENAVMQGAPTRIEKQYIDRIRRTAGEGSRIARQVNALFESARNQVGLRWQVPLPGRVAAASV
jgi:signal transduction histidine kinase